MSSTFRDYRHMEKIEQNTIVNDSRWIEDLALEELNMDESGVVNINNHLDPINFLEHSSVEFMDKIRDIVEFYVSKFNMHRGSNTPGSHIKIFKISNTVNDFMLFRNSLRLVFARRASDKITIGFLVNGKDLRAPRLANGEAWQSNASSHELRAKVGPFNDITWTFNGEPVALESMVRHYLSEFVRNSSR